MSGFYRFRTFAFMARISFIFEDEQKMSSVDDVKSAGHNGDENKWEKGARDE